MSASGALCSASLDGSDGRGSSARSAFSTRDDVRRRLDVGEVAELPDPLDVVEHVAELLAHPLLLVLGQLEAGEAGDVEHLVTAQHAPGSLGGSPANATRGSSLRAPAAVLELAGALRPALRP